MVFCFLFLFLYLVLLGETLDRGSSSAQPKTPYLVDSKPAPGST